ncbi:MAG: ribonuclease HII [Alphaproteobacteria bacterium]|nr:ribonuclease HII [Alphaproteobacteria bacterium]
MEKNTLACGIDEVGRGPLAGPVVSACVMIKSESAHFPEWQNITDSKKLSAKRRDTLYDFIIKHSFHGLGEASVAEIDQLNIHHATLLAMKRAFENMLPLLPSPFHSLSLREREGPGESWKGEGKIKALIDGKFAPNLPCKTETIIKGDSKSIEIGTASIIAKVTRDRMMAKLHEEYPHYAWDKNAGYGTKAHKDGLAQFGLTPHHRLSFSPCAALIKKSAA